MIYFKVSELLGKSEVSYKTESSIGEQYVQVFLDDIKHTKHSLKQILFRVIFKDPKFFGLKADIIDVNYRDISNVRLKRGMFLQKFI